MDRYLVAGDRDPVTSFKGVTLTPRCSFSECPQLDVIFVPGGSNPVQVLLQGHLGANPLLDFLVRQEKNARLVCSVCSGALLLAGAGFPERARKLHKST